MNNTIEDKIYSYSTDEQIASAISHGIGAMLAIAGLVVLVVSAALQGSAIKVVSFSIYGASLFILMLCSTLYHSIPHIPTQRILRIFDHSSIYLLIAGTYTPFALVTIDGGWGWSLFGVIWGLAIFGIIMKIFFTGRFEKLSLLTYGLMGWLVVIAIKPFISSISTVGLCLTVAGGVVYTAGIVFYAVEKIKYNHAIWHLFVLGGAVCHFFAIYLSVL